MAPSERRNSRRYPLRLPLSARPPGASADDEILSVSKDVSSHGVYFCTRQSLKSGSPLEIMLMLPAEIARAAEPVRVRCEARVQRTESVARGRVGIAAKIDRYHFLPARRDGRKAG